MKRNRNNISYGLNQPLNNDAPEPVIANRAPTASDSAALGTIWCDKTTDTFYVLTSIVEGGSAWIAGGGGSVAVDAILGDSGEAKPVDGNIYLQGAAGNGVSFVASGDTVECALGALVADSLNATNGNIDIDAGDLLITEGDIIMTLGDITVTEGDVTLTEGNLTLTDGDVTLTNGTVFVNGIDGGISCDGSAGGGSGWLTMNNGASIDVRSPGKLYASTVSVNGDVGSASGETSFTNVTVAASAGGGALTIDSNSAGSGTNAGFLKAYVGTTVIYIPYFTNVAP